jgi:hypothetical protein
MTDNVHLTPEAAERASADAGQKEMLTQAEAEAIATKLNHSINLPILGEEKEQIVFCKIVKKIDEFLYSVLPNEIYGLIRIAEGGIDPHEAVMIENNLASIATKYIDIPIVPKAMEETIFRVVIGTVVRAMLKNKTINNV